MKKLAHYFKHCVCFKPQHYNEFREWVRWHDYFAFCINEFHILTIRRYDLLRKEWTDVDGTYEPVSVMLSFVDLYLMGVSFRLKNWVSE